MTTIEFFLEQLNAEVATTRKMLERIPDDKYDWKPHEKSMNIRSLATHIAELPDWIGLAINTDELDFATAPYDPAIINKTSDLVALYDKCLDKAKADLNKADDSKLESTWTLRNGKDIYAAHSKRETIRHAFCQIVHHRAQLGVYLRLLNIP